MKALAIALLLFAVGCRSSAQKREGPEAPYLRVIEEKCKELTKLGRAPDHFYQTMDCVTTIGNYGWHGNGGGYFGTYEFSQAAFDQAKRGWWGIHGKVIEGSDEFWVEDNSRGDSRVDRLPIKFDSSVVGLSIGKMYMSWVDAKTYEHKGDWFTAKVVAIIDDGENLKLDKRAAHHAEQYGMSLVPTDYVDMCNCTNNFGPAFVNGKPQVEP